MITGNCYLAGSWSDRPRLRGIRDELAALGIAVNARWLDAPEDGDPQIWAMTDYVDLTDAQTLILFTDVPSTSGGMWFECGLAFGLHKPIIGIGPQTNLFCCLADNWYPAWPELRAALTREDAA